MLRKQARQRREYLYSKALSERVKSKKKAQESIVQSLDQNKTVNSPIIKKGIDVYSSLKYDDKGMLHIVNTI
ncbi:blast:U3 small nucleolar ribonucleoprotein protein IMP4 [Drosophila guanche]|uniref:Blast:U3 small nucleolar ribonucleoprotein protein IMP4 n=1 Tax=Drosophila guanche TaxID=7266 RepID=A0A3B0JQK0_DROGU|nr:blast:U3 small nucleolar ribonucleoprotein protein IMP4 [Drosophila guanche]